MRVPGEGTCGGGGCFCSCFSVGVWIVLFGWLLFFFVFASRFLPLIFFFSNSSTFLLLFRVLFPSFLSPPFYLFFVTRVHTRSSAPASVSATCLRDVTGLRSAGGGATALPRRHRQLRPRPPAPPREPACSCEASRDLGQVTGFGRACFTHGA